VIAELELLSRRSVDVFEFENGLIMREREYYDHIVWKDSKKVAVCIKLNKILIAK
jgi:hypothetical protein